MSWNKVADADDLILHLATSESDETSVEEISPETDSKGVTWHIEHFSVYYYRRR
jgi:hypothetical protein